MRQIVKIALALLLLSDPIAPVGAQPPPQAFVATAGQGVKVSQDTRPEQDQLAFVSTRDGSLQIYLINSDGTAETRLTSPDQGGNWLFAWSPDGQRIAFTSNRAPLAQIYVMDADGSGQKPLATLATGAGLLGFHAWSPDGRRLAFVELDREGQPGRTHIANADGSGGPVALPFPRSLQPVWSPDGQRLLLVVVQDGTCLVFFFRCAASVYVMNTDGGNPRRVTTSDVRIGAFTSAAWSPDSRQIFVGLGEPQTRIHVVNADGSGQRPVADGSAPARCSAGRLVFAGGPLGTGPIITMNLDGTGRRALPPGTNPVCSPDGAKIAYLIADGGQLDVHMMNADGSNARKLAVGVSGAGIVRLLAFTGGPFLAWRPR